MADPGFSRGGTPTSESGTPTYYYRPQRSCGQGNIFTPVCHSVHRGVYLSACWDTTPLPRRPPAKETPLPRRHLPPGPHPRGNSGGSGPGPHPRGKLRGIRSWPTPKGKLRGIRTSPPPFPPGSRLQHTVNEQPVRILLECILVLQIFRQKLHENQRIWTEKGRASLAPP